MPDDEPAAQPARIMQANIPFPSKLETEGSTAANWKKFKRIWTNYEIAARLKNEPKALRTATLLTCIGPDALEVFDGFVFVNDDEEKDIDVVLRKFEDYFVGATNEIYERYKFNSRVQEEGESIDTFITALRRLAKTCNYGTLSDHLIRDRVVIGIRDSGLRKKLLERKDLTFNSCIDMCRASESTGKQIKDITQADNIHVLRSFKSSTTRSKPATTASTRRNYDRNALPTISCKFCGNTHVWKKEECPAWGKQCTKCGKRNHFAVKCSQTTRTQGAVNTLAFAQDDYFEENDEEYTLVLDNSINNHSNGSHSRKLYAHLVIDNSIINFQLDSGATVNIMPSDLYVDICGHKQLSLLRKTTTKLLMFNRTDLQSLGATTLVTLNPKNGKQYELEFTIVNKGLKPLLGAPSIQQLNLMSINKENIMSPDTSSRTPLKAQEILTQYNDVFAGEGKFEVKLHLEIDTAMSPVKLPVRKVPVALKEPLKEELDRLEKMGILAKVEVPTDWISAMVVARKRNGKIRLCIDPKPLNQALKRNHLDYPLPLIDDLLPKLGNAKIFTVVDAKNGFWHVPLDPESSILTTFGTPWGPLGPVSLDAHAFRNITCTRRVSKSPRQRPGRSRWRPAHIRRHTGVRLGGYRRTSSGRP